MDAKPQRPLKALRVQVDENAAPPQSKQTLHSRHKSTGTLSSMLHVGALKAVAKRTAFGDVSNTVRPVGSTQDDSVITGKSNGSEVVKATKVQDKSASFLRPAQRPITAAGLKGMLTNKSSTISSDAPVVSSVVGTKQPVVEIQQLQSQPSKRRNTLTKRPTIIYKDEVIEVRDRPQSSANILPAPESIPAVPTHKPLGPRQHKSQPQLRTDQPILRKIQSKYLTQPESDSRPVSAETVYHEAPETQETSTDAPAEKEAAEEEPEENPTELYESYMRMINRQTEDEVEEQHQDEHEHSSTDLDNCTTVVPSTEPEESWDEEEDDAYDEQGYTTARSLRSHGDNTTGGATTLLFPVVTARIRKEIAAAKEEVEGSRTEEDIEDDHWDISMVAEYGDEIFDYMRELEIRMLPNPHYMDNQAEIQWSMRSVLMDWLVQVHHRFGLLPETLFLCVNYIDRFLSCKVVSLGKLQLVGATAIFVAAKYEEINCPSVAEIVYMVDSGYTIDEILKAERYMLSMLNFELGWPGPMSFLRRISKADDYDLETRTLAKYFLEITIMDERFVGCPASYVAAGAHCLARLMLKKGEWSPAHIYYSNYTYSQLKPLVSMIFECCDNAKKHHNAVFEKYQDRRYKRASAYTQETIARGFSIPSASRPSLPAVESYPDHAPFEVGEAYQPRMVQIRG